MDFLGVGAPELLVVLILALLVLGPEKLARAARTLGKVVREVRQMSSEFTRSLLEEEGEEKKKPRREKPKG